MTRNESHTETLLGIAAPAEDWRPVSARTVTILRALGSRLIRSFDLQPRSDEADTGDPWQDPLELALLAWAHLAPLPRIVPIAAQHDREMAILDALDYLSAYTPDTPQSVALRALEQLQRCHMAAASAIEDNSTSGPEKNVPSPTDC